MKKQNPLAPRFSKPMWRHLLCAASVLATVASSPAATIAFWTFEGDGVTTPTDGTFIRDTDGRTIVTTEGILVQDISGNGNSLFTWDNTASGHQYRTNVPASIVPQTGVPNGFSIQNNGGFPATMTWSTNSAPIVDVETIEPLAWTIEASIYQTASATHETFVGRDGNAEAGFGSDANLAPLYFKTFNGVLQILFVDTAGNFFELGDTNGPISLNQWYNVAAVCDGATLKLYKDSNNGAGYQLVNEMAVAGNPLNYDNEGSTTVNDQQWGWSIGRGRYGNSSAQPDNHVDRFLGYIDNVRISDAALSPNQLLAYSTNVFIVRGPTPATQTVALGASASFTIVAGGESPTYQWRRNGVAIAGATSATYNIPSTSAGSAGNYDVVITNINNAVTSPVAVLEIHNPRNLSWGGVAGGWDTTSANWTTNNGANFLSYFETDHVRFDPLGAAQPLVTLNAPRSPSSIVVSNSSYTLAGAGVTTAGALTLQNNASLVLSNLNNFSGGTVVSGGTLHLRNTNALGALSIAAGAAVQLHGNSQVAAGLAGAGTIITTNGTPILTFGSNNLNATWSGVITNETGGAVSFIKVGTGTNTFSGTNNMAGTAASQINGGTLILPAGGRINPLGTAEFWIGQGVTTGRVEVTGGFLGASNWLVVGRANVAGRGTMIVNSGTVRKDGGGNIVVGSLAATGTLIVNGGQVLNNANLWLGENTGANGTLQLNGGLIQATQIRANGSAPTTSTAFFNGGTLQPTASSADFIASPTIGAIQAGGLVFDGNGFDTTITTMLVEDVLTPSTGGGLTKLGTGSLTLAGGYNYTGPTIVRGGTLSLNPAAAFSSPNVVVSNGTLAVSAGATALPTGNLTLGNGAAVTLNYGNLLGGNPLSAAIATSGNLTASGPTIVINISGNGFTAGTFPLISYGGPTLGSIANFVLGSLPPGMGANLVNNPNSLDLNITVAGQNLSWYGDINNVWDLNNTANWQNSLVPGAKYLEYGATGDPVRFDDTALGNFNVNLTGSVHPYSVTFDSANNYSVTGAGGITGATSIVKSNSGTVFLGTANTHTGGTFIYGGALAVSNSAPLGASANPVTLVGGTLQLENNAVIATRPIVATAASTIGVPADQTGTVGSTISGNQPVRKIDLGTLNLTGSNTITAALDVNQGTLNYSGTNANTLTTPAFMGVGSTLGSATLNVLPGAVLNRFELKLGNQPGAKGTANLTNATLVTGGGEIWVGGSADNIICEGEMNVVNSSVLVSNWTAIGRSFGASGASKGVLNIIGGTWTNRGANHFVITSANNNNGRVNVTDGGILHVGTGNVNNQLWVAERGNGVLNINNGSVIAARPGNPAMIIGAVSGSFGSVRLSSGTLNSADQTYLGSGGSGSYAEINQSGGTLVSRWYLVVGRAADRAIYSQSGGACFVTNRFMTVAAGANSIGVADFSGGSYTALDAAGDGGIYLAENGVGTLNVRGSSTVSVAGTATGGGLRIANGAATRGIVNLNTGGTITANRISRGNQGATSPAILNFNGGRLNARMNNATFLTNITSAFIHAGGAIIDDGGFAVNIAQPLLAPTDLGVTAIEVADGGGNYIGAPLVQISGGTGTNCTAVANMVDDGSGNGTFRVGSITVTGPGTYTVAPTTVTFLSGGQNATVATAGAITTAPNTSGGLTKLGNGTLNLNGVNTYTGTTTVSAGTLGGSGTIAGPVVVASGATLAPGNGLGTLTLGAAPSLNAGSTIVAELNRTNSQTSDRIVVTGNPIAYNGTLVLKNIGQPLQAGDTFTVFNASSYSGGFTIVSQTLGQNVTWNTANLAVDGTVSVAAVSPAPFSLGAVQAGNTLNLSWPPNLLGLRLETNAVSLVNPAAWFTYPGSTSVTNVSLTIDPTKANVFFRLVAP